MIIILVLAVGIVLVFGLFVISLLFTGLTPEGQLHTAIKNDDPDGVIEAINDGASPDAQDPICLMGSPFPRARVAGWRDKCPRPLDKAIKYDRTTIISIIIEAERCKFLGFFCTPIGPDVTDGHIHKARSKEALAALLKAYTETRDSKFWSEYLCAKVRYGQPDLILFLLDELGADPNAICPVPKARFARNDKELRSTRSFIVTEKTREQGWSPLHVIVGFSTVYEGKSIGARIATQSFDFTDSIRHLVAAGADVNKRAADGKAPLHISASFNQLKGNPEEGQLKEINTFIELGADRNAKDKAGQRPCDVYMSHRSRDARITDTLCAML